MPSYHRILAIAELSAHDARVLRRGAQLSRWSGAPLLVLHVLDYAPGFDCDQAPMLTRAQVEDALAAAAREKIGALLLRLGVDNARVLVLRGRPWQVAAAVAQEWQTDLLVCSKAARYRADHLWPTFDASRAYAGEVLSVRAEPIGLGARLRAWLQPLRQS